MTKLPGQINLHEKDDTFYVAKKAHESLYIHVSLKMCSESKQVHIGMECQPGNMGMTPQDF